MDGNGTRVMSRGAAPASRSPGFTLVELIAVVILLSILGTFAMSRMVSPSLFAPAIVAEALVAEVSSARQIAAARHDAVVSVTVDRLGDDWRLRIVSDVDGLLHSELVEADNTALTASSGAASASLDSATALTVSFDYSGGLDAVSIGADPGTPATGVAVTVAGDSVRQICIYPNGYANSDACS